MNMSEAAATGNMAAAISKPDSSENKFEPTHIFYRRYRTENLDELTAAKLHGSPVQCLRNDYDSRQKKWLSLIVFENGMKLVTDFGNLALLNKKASDFQPTHKFRASSDSRTDIDGYPVEVISNIEGLSQIWYIDNDGDAIWTTVKSNNLYPLTTSKEPEMHYVPTLTPNTPPSSLPPYNEQFSRRGKISGDRVHFTIPSRLLSRSAYSKLLDECFGIKASEYNRTKDLKVICRPSQFARFIILRHTKYGETNDFAVLDMKLVSPSPENPENLVDCSTRPNTAVGETV